MSSFVCKVLTPQGQIVKLKMVEDDRITCLKKLKRNGMTPISVKNSYFFKRNLKSTAKIRNKTQRNLNNFLEELSNKIEIQDVKKFTQEIYLLRKSQFTTNHALITIIKNTEDKAFKEILKEMLKNIENGNYMYEVMEKHYDIFPLVYVNFIKMGEVTGDLENSLQNAMNYLENKEEIKSKVEKIIIPNLIMFFGIIVLTIVSVCIGIPVLQDIFKTNGTYVTLPNSTLIFTEIISNLAKNWKLILIILVAIGIIFIRYINTEKGKYKLDHLKYTNFVFGKLKYLLDFSKLLKSTYINLQNKMRLQDALEISKGVEKNTYMINTLEEAISNIYIGKSWIETFEKEKLLSPIIIEMLKKSTNNNLTDVMEKVIKYVDFEIENQIDRLLKILPMFSYGIVGMAILIFTVIILIPCIQVYLGGFLFI